MARIDDYASAKDLAVEKLKQENFETLLKRSGFDAAGPNVFRVPFLGKAYRISYPEFDFAQDSEAPGEIPLQEQVLLLHYLLAPMVPRKETWITYREIPDASFYFPAFVKRAADPLKKVFGEDARPFARAAKALSGVPIDAGDEAAQFQVLPRIGIQIILWEGDDEFPPEANILFAENIGELLSPEDIAMLSGMLAYRLMGAAEV